MKKISLLFISLVTIASIATAQAYEGSVQYDNKKQAAIMIDYSYPSKAVENAINELERIIKKYEPRDTQDRSTFFVKNYL